jgi:tetratricopeptide (TPR) repeat protein
LSFGFYNGGYYGDYCYSSLLYPSYALYPTYYPGYYNYYPSYPVFFSSGYSGYPTYSVNNYYYGDAAGLAYYDREAADAYIQKHYSEPTEQVFQEPSEAQELLEGAQEDMAAVDQAEQAKIQQIMMDGVEYFAKGDYGEAMRRFQAVMVQYPGNVDAVLAYAVSQFALENYRRAAEAIRHGVQIDPEVVNVPFDIRDRYGQVGDFSKHLEELETFVRANPDNENGWLVLGFVRHFTFDRELAASTFEILKQRSERDKVLADAFLEAKPLEEIFQSPQRDADVQTAPSRDVGDADNPYGVELLKPSQTTESSRRSRSAEADLDAILIGSVVESGK